LENIAFAVTQQRIVRLHEFCLKMQNSRIMTVECEKFHTLKIQDGGRRHLEDRYSHISMKYNSISMKFHMMCIRLGLYNENPATQTQNF